MNNLLQDKLINILSNQDNPFKQLLYDFLYNEYIYAMAGTKDKNPNATELDIELQSSIIFVYLLVYNLFSLDTLKDIHESLLSYSISKQNSLILRFKQLESKLGFFYKHLTSTIKNEIIDNLTNHYVKFITLNKTLTKKELKKISLDYKIDLENFLNNPETSYLIILLYIIYFIPKEHIYQFKYFNKESN